jgi:hypothetical protein
MFRNITLAAVAALALAMPAAGKRIAPAMTAVEKLTHADVVVIGKVSALEKEMVNATPYPNTPEKLSYKVAVIKIETGLVGAGSTTHIKVGFIPPPPNAVAPGRGGFQPVNLTEGMEGLFYLTKHHSGEFYVINPRTPPSDTKMDNYKDQVAQAKKGAAVLADPMKALKAEKVEDRVFAAIVMANKYRAYPEGGVEAETAKTPADESKLILKALAEADWKQNRDANTPGAFQTFSLLGLNDKDGWKFPVVKAGEDYIEKAKEAFVKWLDGPGKDYQINKWVPKKK